VGAHRVPSEAIGDRRAAVCGDREQIAAAAAQRSGVFAAEDELSGKGLVKGGVQRRRANALELGIARRVADALALVIQADQVHHAR
jgi:hypothetical protein